METGDLATTCACFADDAVVTSPVYGKMPFRPFYERLYADTVKARVDIRQIYCSVSDQNQWAAHFDYQWTRHDGNSLSSSLVDLFGFTSDGDKIQGLEIIFDRGAMSK